MPNCAVIGWNICKRKIILFCCHVLVHGNTGKLTYSLKTTFLGSQCKNFQNSFKMYTLKPYQNTKGQTLSKMQNTQLNHFFPPIPSKQFEFYVDPFSRSSVIRLCTFLFHICFVKSMGETFFLGFWFESTVKLATLF